MEVTEAILTRRSIRAFKPDPVPREVLEDILSAALRSPSDNNIQPWEFVVVGGPAMEQMKREMQGKFLCGEPPHHDIPFPQYPPAYLERSRHNGRRLFEVLGIARDDPERRNQWWLYQARAFDAPNGIVVCADEQLSAWSTLDVGIVMQTIMIVAHDHGLGTCAQAIMVCCPEVLRGILSIPRSKRLVCGIAIGYPDQDAAVNRFVSDRLPLETLATWVGFDDK